jgi:hypothetical protein
MSVTFILVVTLLKMAGNGPFFNSGKAVRRLYKAQQYKSSATTGPDFDTFD